MAVTAIIVTAENMAELFIFMDMAVAVADAAAVGTVGVVLVVGVVAQIMVADSGFDTVLSTVDLAPFLGYKAAGIVATCSLYS